MSDGAAFLVDCVMGDTPIRHWVLSLPPPLRYLLAYDPSLTSEVLAAFLDSVFRYLRWKGKRFLGLDTVKSAHPGAVTAIQRSSSHLQLNVHFHSLVTDGVFVQEAPQGPVVFHELPPPTDEEVTQVAWETCKRTRDILLRRGLWQEEPEPICEESSGDLEPALTTLYRASLRGVISLGPHRGQRVVRFFGEAAQEGERTSAAREAGAGFNLHARQSVAAGDRQGLERLARYGLRPPLARARLHLDSQGRVVLHMKRTFRDGTTRVAFEPMDFLAKLVALVPRPGTNILRFHGVYAPNARLRCQVVPTREEAGRRPCHCGPGIPSPEPNRLCWAELLQRTWNLDVFACPRCNSKMVRIAWVTTADAIRKILTSVGLAADAPAPAPARSAEELFGQASLA